MPDHPIQELHDMKDDFHANPHTRMAIILCSVLAVVIIVGFLLFAQVVRAPALPVDPVAAGAASAFDVAPAPPNVETPPAVQPYDGDAAAPAPLQPAAPAPAPVIAPADLTP